MADLQDTCRHEDWDWQELGGVDFMVCNDCDKTLGTTCPSCHGGGIVHEDEYEGDMDQITSELDRIRGEMAAWVGQTDYEAAHSEADGLLIEALQHLARYSSKDASIQIHAIIKAWTAIGKWYA